MAHWILSTILVGRIWLVLTARFAGRFESGGAGIFFAPADCLTHHEGFFVSAGQDERPEPLHRVFGGFVGHWVRIAMPGLATIPLKPKKL